MQVTDLKHLEELISKLDQDRKSLLKDIDSGKWSNHRSKLAGLEREISKFILRVREYNSEIQKETKN
tara:strand:- start:77 stop:277 length:201 start_codon:yes stop_codon:yes gene_type:complete